MNAVSSVRLVLLIFASAGVLSIGCRQDPQSEADDGHDHEAEEHETADSAVAASSALSLIDLETTHAVRIDVDEIIKATGKVINNQNNEIHINALIPGRVNEALADWGETVRKGQTLVCIESIELGKTRADYERALADLELADAEFQRVDRLYKLDAVSEKRLLEARADLRAARIDLDYAEKMLLLTGLKKEEILEPPDEHPTIPGCSFHLTSPISGVVIERNIVKGEKIEPGDCVYKILDLSTVWVETDVYEKDLARIKNARRVQVTVPAFPDRVFGGEIVFLGATLDESTRTVKLRSVVANPDYALKPGMFAEVGIVIGSNRNVLAVPLVAVLSEGDDRFVFVREGDEFHRHEVETGLRTESGMVAILSGITEDDEIVVQGQHQINSQILMKEADPHAGHTH